MTVSTTLVQHLTFKTFFSIELKKKKKKVTQQQPSCSCIHSVITNSIGDIDATDSSLRGSQDAFHQLVLPGIRKQLKSSSQSSGDGVFSCIRGLCGKILNEPIPVCAFFKNQRSACAHKFHSSLSQDQSTVGQQAEMAVSKH